MRAIKFRAWDKDNSIMRYSENDGEDSGEGPIVWELVFGQPQFSEPRMINENQDMGYKAPNQELMQYTGLKDKNGKEIYEGDILKYSYYYEGGQWGEVRPAVYPQEVKWLPLSTGFTPFQGWSDYGEQLKRCEVIGNIYENPELLGIKG